jgi:hypothetical protein
LEDPLDRLGLEPFKKSFIKRFCYRRVLSACSLLLSTLKLAVLLVTFEPRTQANVDPGSGFVFLQIASSMFAGTISTCAIA